MKLTENSFTDINVAHHKIIKSIVGYHDAFIIACAFLGYTVNASDNYFTVLAFQDRISLAADTGDSYIFSGLAQFFNAALSDFNNRSVKAAAQTAVRSKHQQQIIFISAAAANQHRPINGSSVFFNHAVFGNNISGYSGKVFTVWGAGSD